MGFIHGLFEFMNCVISGKLLDFSVPQLPQHQIMTLIVATPLDHREN